MEGSSNDQRINQAEKKLAVLEHRVGELEGTPPRVHNLENSVSQLEVQFQTLNNDISEIKQEGKETHSLLLKLGEDVRKLFFIGAVLASLGSAVLVGLKIYDSVQTIQEKSAQEVRP